MPGAKNANEVPRDSLPGGKSTEPGVAQGLLIPLRCLQGQTLAIYPVFVVTSDLPGGSDSKASVYNVGDLGSIPGSGSSLEKEMATHASTLA